MNWGKGIALFLILFICTLAFMVYKTTVKTSELVTENYYEEELKHEQVIQAEKNATTLNEKPKIQVNNSTVEIQLPKELDLNKIQGDIYFYKPDDTKKDRKIKISLDQNYSQQIEINKLFSGLYQVKLNWKQDSLSYYFEQNIFIP